MGATWERQTISPCLRAKGSGINNCKSEGPRVSSMFFLPWMAQGSLENPDSSPPQQPRIYSALFIHLFLHSIIQSTENKIQDDTDQIYPCKQ